MSEEVVPRRGKEGARWINQRPSGDEVAKWFAENVPMHEGLEHKDFVSGVVVIQQTEKSHEVDGFDPATNAPLIREVAHVTYTPYIKVETRVAYFWKLLSANPDWVGAIEPVESHYGGGTHPVLPPGFFLYSATREGVEHHFVACTMRVRLYKRDTAEYDADGRITGGEPVAVYPPATKQVPIAGKFEVDPSAMMKAETGAIGRALGVAGILVAPGTGISTAEDLAEVVAGGGASPSSAPPRAPAPAQPAAEPPLTANDRVLQINALIERLKGVDVRGFGDFVRWCKEDRGWETLGGRSMDELVDATKWLERRLDSFNQGSAKPADVAPPTPTPLTAEAPAAATAEGGPGGG
jgi:hypothetical protein